MTPITQPMGQGVIRSLKAKYCSLAFEKQIDALEKGNQLFEFSSLTAMPMLTKAWNYMPDGTFKNCFKKSGISEKSMEKAINDLEMMKEKYHENYDMTTEELVDIDFEISAASTSSDVEIIAEVSGHVGIDDFLISLIILIPSSFIFCKWYFVKNH